MAIQFPPINVGDPAPSNGDVYIYLQTREEFVYDAVDNSWTPRGLASPTAFGFQGTVEVKKPAPADAETGYIYSVLDGGLAAEIDSSFQGLAGVYDVPQWQLIVFSDPDWLLIETPVGPWVRTAGGQIQPIINTDDLNMLDGNYVIEQLDDLPT